jgi:hypothetical protein
VNNRLKIVLQVGVVLLTGGALMLSGGVASALPSAPVPIDRADCARVEAGDISGCVSVLLSRRIGDRSLPVQLRSLPWPCIELTVQGVRVTIGQASPPVQCLSLPRRADALLPDR